MTEQLLTTLVDLAQEHKPRFFAICGVYPEDDATYIAWGMEFTDQAKAVAWMADEVFVSTSAEQILNLKTMISSARLVWFE